MTDQRSEPLYHLGRRCRVLDAPVRTALLGATGSIGTQTVDLALRHPGEIRIEALTVRTRVAELAELVKRLEAAGAADRPWVAVLDADAHARAAADPILSRRLLPPGEEGVNAAAGLDDVDCVVNGLVGAAGLEPTLVAAERGRRLALANKEALVIGGDLVREAVRRGGAEVIPVDSEHSALAQCLCGRSADELESLVLTASGGPCREWSAERLATATRAEVLAHPTWEMGPKITVDSATLMNKGLEVIEAHVLFGVGYDAIEVAVHPGSIVHSLAVFRDGAVMAQLGAPDMRVPLLYAVTGERHLPLETERLDLRAIGELRFGIPDEERFPCLRLAREAGLAGGRTVIALNAANEEAVAAFLDDRVGFLDIPRIIDAILDATEPGPVPDLETALAYDRDARRLAAESIPAR